MHPKGKFETAMRVLVMAAGGIGGYYGGLLAQAGHDVTFVARGPHLDAIRKNGLHVKSIDDEFVIKPARVEDHPLEKGPLDLVLFSVKTYDTAEAAREVGRVAGSETAIVTFQNGVESADDISAFCGKGRVVWAPTQIETFIAAPGRIEQKSNFRVVTFGENDVASIPAIAMLAEVFKQAKFQVNFVPDIRKAVWLKFLRLAPVSGFATLARANPYDLFQIQESQEMLTAAMREIVAVGIPEGVGLGEADVSGAKEWAMALKDGIKPSMQKDIERGKRLEIDALSGAVVRLGRKHSIPTPVNETIYVGLKPEDNRNGKSKDR